MSEKGILNVVALPDSDFNSYYNSIHLPQGLKEQMVRQIVLTFQLRGKIPFAELPIHGVIALMGPPGTGKTSIAKGIASKAAEFMKATSNINFIEVEPHGLASSALGRSQKDVRDLLMVTVREKALKGPTIVLLDEVETLAADRNKLSLSANPIDVHRATDAVLASLDTLARENRNLIFIMTSNFQSAVDSALLSRADAIFTFENPTREACQSILESTLLSLGKQWSPILEISKHKKFIKAIDAASGLDGRKIRKSVFSALASQSACVSDPGQLTVDDLIAALTLAGGKDSNKGATHDYQ